LYNGKLYYSPSVITILASGNMRQVRHAANDKFIRNFCWKSEGKTDIQIGIITLNMQWT